MDAKELADYLYWHISLGKETYIGDWLDIEITEEDAFRIKAKTERTANVVFLTLANGQKFMIAVSELKRKEENDAKIR